MFPTFTTTSKAELRLKKFQERLKQKPSFYQRKNKAILHRIKSLNEFKNARNIMVYYPIHNEVSLIDLIKESADKRFIFPKVLKQNKLSLFFVKDIKYLTPGKFGIPEPTTGCRRAKPTDINLILVPGIVFDQSGHRIGFGKGYYDRLLKDVTCPKIGVAYDFQIVKNIPSEKHDIPMDIIVTNRSILSTPTKLPIKPTSK